MLFLCRGGEVRTERPFSSQHPEVIRKDRNCIPYTVHTCVPCSITMNQLNSSAVAVDCHLHIEHCSTVWSGQENSFSMLNDMIYNITRYPR